MSNSIFDWEDEDERQVSEPPVEIVDPEPLDAWETRQWDGTWKEEAVEKQEAYESTEFVYYKPETADETARRGSLAWSAGIVFFSSVAFMLLFGWVVDYLLQVSPWGIVGGIILGSIIGFIQFFRISSQIFNPSKAESSMRPLMPRDDEEKFH